MKKKTKNTFSIVKIICVCAILILLSGVGVMAVTTQINNVSITLSNGYEMKVLTSKTKISEILSENNIILEDDERVTPGLDEDLTETKEIMITDKSNQEIKVAKVSESGVATTLDSLLEAYSTITEKIETAQEAIPYETVTKDVSAGSSDTKNKVIQEGEDGIRKVTYKVKYQNDTEIERNKLSEEVIKEPVQKIVQVQAKQVVSTRSSETTRSASASTSSSYASSSNVKVYKITAYCASIACCGKTDGITASGVKARANRTVAAPSNIPFGTKLLINGKEYVVEDRGGAVKGNKLDIFVNSYAEARAWGVRYLPVQIIQ